MLGLIFCCSNLGSGVFFLGLMQVWMQLNVLGLGLGFKSQNLQMKVTFAHLQLNHCFNHGV